jgi:hypothetical protein
MPAHAFFRTHGTISAWDPGVLIIDAASLFWLIAYVLAIVYGFKNRSYAIPAAAVCLNFSWEVLASFEWIAPVLLWHIGAIAWLAVDLIIVYQLYRFGSEQQRIPELKRWWYAIVTAGLLFALAGQHYGAIFDGDPLGFEDAYLINLVMSMLFIAQFFSRRDASVLVYGVAWTKMLGTALTSLGLIFVLPVLYPDKQSYAFMYLLYLACLLLDSLYIFLIAMARARASMSAT